MNIVNVGYDSTNYYVLADRAPRLMVDTGWPGTLPKLTHACRRAGIELADIPFLLVTHYHPDHAGLVPELQRTIKLIVVDLQRPFVPALGRYMKPQHQFKPIELAGAVVIDVAGSRAYLEQLGVGGALLHTPGHSDDSVTLLLDDGAAFTGDLTPPVMIDDPGSAAQRSWDALRAAGATTIYPGHGPQQPLR